MDKKYAYITLVSSEDYVFGAIVMYYSWKETNSKYPFLCLVTNNISLQSKSILRTVGFEVIEVLKYAPTVYKEMLETIEPEMLKDSGVGKDFNKNGWQNCWSKFYCWQLTDYDKLVYYDADTWFVKNCDELFNYPHMSALEDWQGFCAGMLVIEPSLDELNKLLELSEQSAFHQNTLNNDQFVLNQYHSNWKDDPNRILPDYFHKRIIDLDFHDTSWFFKNQQKIRAFHLVGQKPWIEGKQYIDFLNTHERPMQGLLEGLYLVYCNLVIAKLKTLNINKFWSYYNI